LEGAVIDEQRQKRAGLERIVLTVSLAAALSTWTFLIGFWSGWDIPYETHYFLGVGLATWTQLIAITITAVALGFVLMFLADYGISGFRALVSVVACLATFPLAHWISFTVLNAMSQPTYVGP
jgi:hypothetical protein